MSRRATKSSRHDIRLAIEANARVPIVDPLLQQINGALNPILPEPKDPGGGKACFRLSRKEQPSEKAGLDHVETLVNP